MRLDADAERIRRFTRELGRATSVPARLYLVGGASAVLERWRATTLDIDLRLEPADQLFRFPAVDPPSLRAAVERLAR